MVLSWWLEAESNRRHKDFQSSALPTELSSLRRAARRFKSGPPNSARDISAVAFRRRPLDPSGPTWPKIRFQLRVNCYLAPNHTCMKKKTSRLLIALLGCALATASLTAAPAGKTLDLYWIDSEGGGSTLIVTPAGESVLIDSGNPGGRDAGRIHQTAAQVAGLKRIDHYITTHFHTDHFGGAAELAELMPMVNVWDNGIPEQDPDGNPDSTAFLSKIKPYREMRVVKRHVIAPGDSLPLQQVQGAAKLTLRCLGAKQKVLHDANGVSRANALCVGAREKEKDDSDNANSIVSLLEFGP